MNIAWHLALVPNVNNNGIIEKIQDKLFKKQMKKKKKIPNVFT